VMGVCVLSGVSSDCEMEVIFYLFAITFRDLLEYLLGRKPYRPGMSFIEQ